MNDKTLVFLADKKNVLLAMKKKGFGSGKWNGYGGKVEKGETILKAAIRELKEESGIEAKEKELEFVGKISFVFLEKPEWNQDVHIFLIKEIRKAIETEEMKPKIFKKNNLPFKQMWDGDKHWIPIILEKKEIIAKLEFVGKGVFKKIIFEKPFKKTIIKQENISERQKIALERINILFELARKQKEESLKKKYLKLAKKIGERTNVSIPKELKKIFCKKCFSMKIKKIEKKPFIITKCEECGFEKKYSLK
ncbi:MAG: NUDIX domain-containing protein [Candidatus ainarchaeum sp.]|nr:NUDIX domain-containing protein [Candidatus ainarchaeum sp.]